MATGIFLAIFSARTARGFDAVDAGAGVLLGVLCMFPRFDEALDMQRGVQGLVHAAVMPRVVIASAGTARSTAASYGSSARAPRWTTRPAGKVVNPGGTGSVPRAAGVDEARTWPICLHVETRMIRCASFALRTGTSGALPNSALVSCQGVECRRRKLRRCTLSKVIPCASRKVHKYGRRP